MQIWQVLNEWHLPNIGIIQITLISAVFVPGRHTNSASLALLFHIDEFINNLSYICLEPVTTQRINNA